MRFGLSRNFWLMLIAVALVTAAAIGLPRAYRVALLGSGFMAKTLCSGLFVSGRDMEALMGEDLSGPGLWLLRFFQPAPDAAAKTVTASTYGFAVRTAIHRDGLGCTLLDGAQTERLRAEAAGLFPPAASIGNDAEWPEGEQVAAWSMPETVDGNALQAAIEAIFAEPDPDHPRRTRALVVVHGGRIVAERYAPGFDAHMPLIGWSMAKTAINVLAGLRVDDGALALDSDALMPAWRTGESPKRAITLDALMRMTSGLSFSENYNDDLSNVAQMLFVQGNAGGFAASKPLAHTPGTVWSYSSGTTNIIASVLRETFGDARDYLRFPRLRLFEPLGMRSAVLEPDAAGGFVGSSFLYASARDWARLGLLFLRDGMWEGKRLLPEGWVAYSLRPTPQSPGGQYGAQVWIKLPSAPGLGEPPMPDDAYYMLGYNGQVAVMVPSRDLVVVRLGHTPKGGDWETARDLAPLVNAFPTH
jgi:CubicO group peptidase (beta-lactamase class C family)